MKRIAQLAAIVLLLACAAFGQSSVSESEDFMVAANAAACAGSLQTPPVTYSNCKPLVAGTVTLTHEDQRRVFSSSHSLELNWTGTAAATATVTIKGCGRGLTCAPTALATSTSITNSLIAVPTNTPFDQLQITVAWTGGDATTFLTIHLTGAFIPPIIDHIARWAVNSAVAVGNQASASKAAGGAGVRHVASVVCLSAAASTAPVATQVAINLRDGATGAGTVLWQFTTVVGATATQLLGPFCSPPLNIVGSPNTAMTWEFSAGVANVFEQVSITGYDTTTAQ